MHNTTNVKRGPAQLTNVQHFAGLSSARPTFIILETFHNVGDLPQRFFCLLSIRPTLEFQSTNGNEVGKSSARGNKVKIKLNVCI